MSAAACAGPPPGQGSGPSGTAELLRALSLGSGLGVAERMERGTNTAFVGLQLGGAPGLGAAAPPGRDRCARRAGPPASLPRPAHPGPGAPLAGLAAGVGAHHERLDGSGYPLGTGGQGLPIGARVLAAADAWAERARDRPPDLTGEKGLDPACTAALPSCARPDISYQRRPSHAAAASLALSSRELEVLRLLAESVSNPAISKALYISRRTAEHHVELILTKLGVTSRTAAVAYALTHELLS